MSALEIALLCSLILVGSAIFILGIIASIIKIVLVIKYIKYNKYKIASGLTSAETGRALLDASNLQKVEIVKSNWFLAQIFGNRYSVKDKKIKLRKNIMDKSSISAVGITCQKVAFAISDSKGNKEVKLRSALAPIVMFGPFMLVPIILVGVIIDLLLTSSIGLISIISILLSFSFLIMSVIVLGITIKIEKNANITALKMLENSKFLNSEELSYLKELFNLYILDYVIQFVVVLLEIVMAIIKLCIYFFKAKKN